MVGGGGGEGVKSKFLGEVRSKFCLPKVRNSKPKRNSCKEYQINRFIVSLYQRMMNKVSLTTQVPFYSDFCLINCLGLSGKKYFRAKSGIFYRIFISYTRVYIIKYIFDH